MNHEQEQRITCLLLSGYREDEVVSNIALEYSVIDEFDLEDLPRHVARINHQIQALGEVT